MINKGREFTNFHNEREGSSGHDTLGLAAVLAVPNAVTDR